MPPLLLVDRELEKRSMPEMYFLVARALELCRSGSLMLFAEDERRVGTARFLGMMYAAERHGAHHQVPCLELEVNQGRLCTKAGVEKILAAVAPAAKDLSRPTIYR